MTNKKGRAAEGYLRYPGLFIQSNKMDFPKAFRFAGVYQLQRHDNADNPMVIRYLRQQVSDILCFAKFSVDFFPEMWYNILVERNNLFTDDLYKRG